MEEAEVISYDESTAIERIETLDIYGQNLSYSLASMQASLGRRVKRRSWNNHDKEQHIADAPFIFCVNGDNWNLVGVNICDIPLKVRCLGFHAIFMANDSIAPYAPSDSDILALDWYVIDPEQDIFES